MQASLEQVLRERLGTTLAQHLDSSVSLIDLCDSILLPSTLGLRTEGHPFLRWMLQQQAVQTHTNNRCRDPCFCYMAAQ